MDTKRRRRVQGSGDGGTKGIYTTAGGTLRAVVDTATNIPDGTGTFNSFPGGAPSIHGGNIAFLGNGSGGQEGVYAEIDGSLVRIADKTTEIPGAGGALFPGFDVNFASNAMIYDGEVAFIAGDEAAPFPNQLGIYKYDGGLLTTVADQSTVVPESGGTLTLFGVAQGLSFYDGDFSFLAQDTIGPQSIVAILDGQVVRVLANGDPIDGETAGAMGSYGQSVDNGSVGFNVGSIAGNAVAIQQHSWVGVGSDTYSGTGTGTQWSENGNWLYGLSPRDIIPTEINPAGAVTLGGPTEDTTIRSLQIGSGVGWAKLMHHHGTTLTVNQDVLIEPQGGDTGTGSIVVHNFSTLAAPRCADRRQRARCVGSGPRRHGDGCQSC